MLMYGAVALTGILPVAVTAQQPSTAVPLVFDGVVVVDVEHGTLLPAQRVVIVGNRIRKVGDVGAVKSPPGARVVDARGKYLIPGLWDLHFHGTSEEEYWTLLANGVTGFRNPAAHHLDTLSQWRREILAGTRIGPPRQILSSRQLHWLSLCQAGQQWPECIPICDAETAPPSCVVSAEARMQEGRQHAREVVREYQTAGADMLKMYDLSREMYFMIAAEARKARLPFGGHLAHVNMLEASDSGARLIDHFWAGSNHGNDSLAALCWGPNGSEEACRPVADRLRRNGTWVVPTLVEPFIAENLARRSQPIHQRLRDYAQAFWAGASAHGNWLRDSTAGLSSGGATDSRGTPLPGVMVIAERVGLPIVAGTDNQAGFPLQTELALYVAEGLTPLHALQSATLNPAKMWQATDSLGTVAPGKLADLVLLDANPLADITNTTTIRAVVANGRYFDRAALDRVLDEVRAKGQQEP